MANPVTKPMYYRGDWVPCCDYAVGEVVTRNGALWLALRQSAGVDPDTAEGVNYWALFGGSDEPEPEKTHNELNGLQGGDGEKGEFYHVLKDHLEAMRQARNPAEGNPFLTAADMPALEKRVEAFRLREKPEGTGALYAVAFGNGAFVAVGDGCAVRSADGREWAAADGVPAGFWRDVAYGGNVFAALGLGGKAMWSEDGGQTWNETTAPEGEWNALAFGNGMFVGVCDGKIVRSLDGKTGWSAKEVPTGYGEDVCFGNGVFVAIGPKGAMNSVDGMTWTEQETPGATWRCVCWDEGIFLALSGKCMVSTDGGQSWAASDLPAGGWDAVCGGGGFFVGVGNSAYRIVTGAGELAWVQTGAPNFLWRALAFGLDTFVAVGSGIMTAKVVDAAAALSSANSPSGENAFATLLDLVEMREALTRQAAALEEFRTETRQAAAGQVAALEEFRTETREAVTRLEESLIIEGEA
ncbi:MAG: hypothetical protein IJR68_01465 [Fretibacterium sp.]|nr:hypothetical protein [Fretibacterium sp.]